MPKITTESSRAAKRVNPLTKPTFDCVACMEQVTGRPAAVIHSCEICQACFDAEDGGIRAQFETFLKDETKQPKWAGKLITIESVRFQFSVDFLEQLHARMVEYAVMPAQRVYCASAACGHFLGPVDEAVTIKQCKCGSFTCSNCKCCLADSQDHTCEDPMEIDQPDPFDGLIKGKDYQFCPNSDCKAPVSQIDGCNHMVCEVSACETEFCYLCGEPAKHSSKHWENPQGCPKYGKKGDPRAIFDEPIPVIIDNADSDVIAMESLQDPFDLTDGAPEQRLRMIDRLELFDTLDNVHALINGYADAERDPPAWLMTLDHLTHALVDTLDIYTLHLEEADIRIRGMLRPLDQRAMIQFLVEAIPLIGWQHFPRMRPIVNTYMLALSGDHAQVATDFGIRQEAAHRSRRRRYSEIALPTGDALDRISMAAYEIPETSLEWPIQPADALTTAIGI